MTQKFNNTGKHHSNYTNYPHTSQEINAQKQRFKGFSKIFTILINMWITYTVYTAINIKFSIIGLHNSIHIMLITRG